MSSIVESRARSSGMYRCCRGADVCRFYLTGLMSDRPPPLVLLKWVAQLWSTDLTRFLGLFCIATAALSLGACDQTSPLAPAPPPRPLPRVPTLSGFVMDDSGSPVANHEVALEEFFTGNKQATTSTNADGYYEVRLGATTS